MPSYRAAVGDEHAMDVPLRRCFPRIRSRLDDDPRNEATAKRRVDRGFALSDHADWPALLHAITAVGPEEVAHAWLLCGARALSRRARYCCARGSKRGSRVKGWNNWSSETREFSAFFLQSSMGRIARAKNCARSRVISHRVRPQTRRGRCTSFRAGESGSPRAKNLGEWAADLAQITAWLFEECHHMVGDLAETIALVLPAPQASDPPALSRLIEEKLLTPAGLIEPQQCGEVVELWRSMGSRAAQALQ